MPELAEVERSRRLWDARRGAKVLEVVLRNRKSHVFRGTDLPSVARGITGQPLFGSEVVGKQMVFRFGKRGQRWLGLHLGMTGELRIEAPTYPFLKYDHLILRQSKRSLVFADTRQFGRVLFAETDGVPNWWAKLPPSILSKEFTRSAVAEFCYRRKGSPLKGMLLMQERFPGIGNWMADEILWRARLNPKIPAGKLSPALVGNLYRWIRWVTVSAMQEMDENWEFPSTWLFSHRWEAGGHCPRCGAALAREKIGGRTTCWCPVCQPV